MLKDVQQLLLSYFLGIIVTSSRISFLCSRLSKMLSFSTKATTSSFEGTVLSLVGFTNVDLFRKVPGPLVRDDFLLSFLSGLSSSKASSDDLSRVSSVIELLLLLLTLFIGIFFSFEIFGIDGELIVTVSFLIITGDSTGFETALGIFSFEPLFSPIGPAETVTS